MGVNQPQGKMECGAEITVSAVPRSSETRTGTGVKLIFCSRAGWKMNI